MSIELTITLPMVLLCLGFFVLGAVVGWAMRESYRAGLDDCSGGSWY